MILTCDHDCPHWQDGKCTRRGAAHEGVARHKPREICMRRKLDLDTTKPEQAALFTQGEPHAQSRPR